MIAISANTFAALQESSAPPSELLGASCVIRHDNQLVMFSEAIIRKMSLPGGYIDAGETAAQAAAREALEETGIEVEVKDLITYRGRAAIFSCVAKTPILVSSFQDPSGYPIVASWFAKHYAKEVRRVYLVDPTLLTEKQYRYPQDVSSLPQWLAQTPSSAIEVYAVLAQHAYSYHRLELEWIETLQNWTRSLPAPLEQGVEWLMWGLNLPGEAKVLALLVVGVTAWFGPRAMLQLFVILMLTMLTSSLIKLGVGSPRPSDIMPELQKVNAYGFGLPSGHTLTATVLWGMGWSWLSHRVGPLLRWGTFCLLPLLIGGQALARVWYGVHFFSDIVVSILLGLVLLALFQWWQAAQRFPLAAMVVSRGFWFISALICGLIAVLTQAPDHTYLFAGLVGLLLVVDQLPAAGSIPTMVTRWQILVASVVGVSLVMLVTELISDHSSVNAMVLVIWAIGWALALMWLVGAPSVIIRRQERIARIPH
ncbi:phosphatase PAP2 family protein [Photobacterium sp. TY1-4]|uniref:phosphatase PAP2 family protein n=1 Tax=Photobacterium sp. TY1-4 TaxID=2899122 RepID=UPI0021C066A3|nr:phosphatase PAP2 family protein [Photobacterium sp. TY1-4]UXI00185.1 phosphatase PAP2 family protein [Photobacterium sp. TY1-4]